MNWFEALVLGLVQGLTEYLPVSSSGHLAIGAYLFGINGEDNLTFTIMVHVATVLSTLVILWKEIDWILKGLFKFQMNEETKYALNIVISMIPVGIVGVFFKDKVEEVFGSGLLIVGCMLLVTAVLLTFSYFAKPRQKENISPLHAFIIGLGQALAVLPGLSRSGTTIATGLLLGDKKEKMAQFSFLMVIPPILGEALLDLLKGLQLFYLLGTFTGAEHQHASGKGIERTGMSYLHLKTEFLAEQIANMCQGSETRHAIRLVDGNNFSFSEIHILND